MDSAGGLSGIDPPTAPSPAAVDQTPALQAADRKIRRAAVVGFLVGGATALFGLVALCTGSDFTRTGLDAFATCDGTMAIALSFGTWRRSRVCATFLAIYFVASKAVMLLGAGSFAKSPPILAVGVTVLLARVLFSGAWATYVHRGLRGATPGKRWSWWKMALTLVAGVVILLVLFGLGAYHYLKLRGIEMPATPGEDLSADVTDELGSLSLLHPGEHPIYFYSDVFFNVRDSLCFFTSDRIEWYSTDWTPPEYSVLLKDVRDISAPSRESESSKSKAVLTLDDGSQYDVRIGTLDEGDRRFFDALIGAWKRARTGVPADHR